VITGFIYCSECEKEMKERRENRAFYSAKGLGARMGDF